MTIPLPPTDGSCPPTFDLSPSYVTALDNEFTKVYDEYERRITLVTSVSEEIIKLWAELGTPQVQTDSTIVEYYREAPEQLGLHDTDLAALKKKRDRLVDEKRGREKKLNDLRKTVEAFWDKLGIDDSERKAFLKSNRGCGLRQINEFEEELSRLNELKRQNLHVFVEDARCRLQELWDALFFSEEEMLDFIPAFSDVYSDALLSAHETEIERLEMLKEQRAPTLALIEKHRQLISDRDSLAASSQDASRLMARGTNGQRRDPARLLREEKMRKRIAKELPKIEADLSKVLEQWEEEYGRPFLVHGERYLDEIAPATTKPAPGPRPQSRAAPRPATAMGKQTPARTNGAIGNNSATGPHTIRGEGAMNHSHPPPARPKTPVNNPPPPKRPMANGAVVSNTNPGAPRSPTKLSPSKIPAPSSRMPLSSTHGNNSPERRPPPSTSSYSSSAIRGKIPPPRAPPPKMRDLLPTPQPKETSLTPVSNRNPRHHCNEPSRCGSAMAMSAAHIRPLTPEDSYDDQSQRSYKTGSSNSSNSAAFSNGYPHPPSQHDLSYSSQLSRNYLQQLPREHQPQHIEHHNLPSTFYPPEPYEPGSRQISNPSTIHTVMSGSENWETFSDGSEPEADATDVYYAKLRAAHGKRMADGGYGHGFGGSGVPGKKVKGIRGVGVESAVAVEEDGQLRHVDGIGESDGWTDEMEAY